MDRHNRRPRDSSNHREEMKLRQSESGRPLLLKDGATIGDRSVEEHDYVPQEDVPNGDDRMRDWREIAREVSGKKFEHLDDSMAKTIRVEFDNECFVQGDKQVDYVLAYEDEDDEPTTSQIPPQDAEKGEQSEKDKRKERRQHFEANLKRMGLELIERAADPKVGRTRYVLIHAPFAVLEKQAHLLNVKLPAKKCDVDTGGRSLVPGCVDRCLDRARFLDYDDDTKTYLEEPDYYTAPYTSDRRHNFVNWDRPDLLFPTAERSRMVYDLLIRARYHAPDKLFEEDDKYSGNIITQFTSLFSVGIDRLLQNGTYTGAYPLHQELRPREKMEEKTLNQRELLYVCWASWRVWYKYQPLDLVKRYFGSKVGFYFAWLGYYTKTLYPAALLGLLCVIFGIIQFSKDPVSSDICSTATGGRIITCPMCNDYCDFQYLNSSCVYARVSYLFDNTMTVVFAALMSVWATLFLEGWKRYHSEVAWKWGLQDYAVEEDTVRPEFQYRVKTTKYNPITKKHEPYLSSRKRMMNFLASGVTVLFFVFLVLGVVFGVMVYRVICLKLLARSGNDQLGKFAFLIVTSTGAMLNLIVILIMNTVYYYLALVLTRWECPRTQTDFDNSFTFKVFLFQFVNYYSSLFYIAFVKGLISQLPAYKSKKDGSMGGAFEIGGARLESCDPAGCFAELVIQLAIIMCGRQFFSAFVEVGYPLIMSAIRRWQFLLPQSKREKEERKRRQKEIGGSRAPRWESDYFLSPTYDQWLFDEYLEMVIQFGFITLFVAAFPLAPFFALINNIMEIRLDAYKFLVTTQRPMPAQSRNIGIWLNILQFLSNISVTVNALVIAFTSDFVPKLYYAYKYSWGMDGYVEWSLSHFDARNLQLSGNYNSMFGGPQSVVDCRFRGFRNAPCSLFNASATRFFSPKHFRSGLQDTCDRDDLYHFAEDWWRVLALRLVFVVVFEHVVFLIKTIVDYLIPDVPQKIFIAQQREKYLNRKAVLEEISSRTGSFRDKRAVSADAPDHAFQPGDFGVEPLVAQRRWDDDTEARSSFGIDTFETASEGSSISDGKLAETKGL